MLYVEWCSLVGRHALQCRCWTNDYAGMLTDGTTVTEAQTVSVELHDIQSGQTEKYYCDG